MKNGARKRLKKSVLFSVLILAAGIFVYSAVCLYVPLSPKDKNKTVCVEIPGGTSTKKIASILKNSSLIRSENCFYLAARLPVLFGGKSACVLKSGVYTVSPGMSAVQILRLLESGRQEYIKTVIPEGLTMRKIGEMLEENGVCPSNLFMSAASDLKLLAEYGIPAENFEGFLFPDTYFFTPNMNASDVVSMMADNFLQKVQEIPRLAGKSVSEYFDTVVLASIVEREYRVASEAPLIASVFKNRIDDNVGLYSCATIEYIITEILNRPHPDVITYDDLKIDSPYNTYKWAGLTPGPISNPGIVALKAAADPPSTDYYYFTLTDAERGTHTFSNSFRSHMKAGMEFKTKKEAK